MRLSREEEEVRTPEHKIMYATRYNLGGLWGTRPVRVKWSEEAEGWWDRSGELGVAKPGLDVSDGCVTFASPDRNDVVNFLRGMLTVAYIESSRIPDRRNAKKALLNG